MGATTIGLYGSEHKAGLYGMTPMEARQERVLHVGLPQHSLQLKLVLNADTWEYTHFDTPSGVLRRIRNDSAIDLVILAPDASLDTYTELCRQIKFDARTAFVSVVFMFLPVHAERRADVFEAGANDCIQFPASPKEVELRLSNAIRVKRATDSLEDSAAVITSLAAAIEGRDAYTCGHVERVSMYSVEIGRRIGVNREGLAALKLGGIVHDIGKVLIPDQILNKPGRLDDIEMELVKRHPTIGYHILKPLRMFRDALPIVRWHHERPNGTGYPDGLEGDQFPLLARIVAVTDVFDAISTTRPYRPALSPGECRAILNAAGESRELDPSLVAALFEVLDEGERAPVGPPAALTIA